MTTKIAINGFGRIGRNVLRAIVESGRDDIRVVAINDLAPVETNAHVFAFDSVHRRYDGEVTTTDDSRAEEHTSELQSRSDLVCRLLREKTIAHLMKHKYLTISKTEDA